MSVCTFNDCTNHAIPGSVKCSFHKNRRQCKSKDCNNQVYARNLCVRHGGKKQCHYDGCDSYARGGNYCIQHGGIVVKRFCSVEGCAKQAHAKQLCVRHGGGRLCRTTGCQHHAREGGLCHKHNQNSNPHALTTTVKAEVRTPTTDAVTPFTASTHVDLDQLTPLPLLTDVDFVVPDLASNMYSKWLQLTQDVLWTLHPDLMGISYAGLLPAAMTTASPPMPPPYVPKLPPTYDLVDSTKDMSFDPFTLPHDPSSSSSSTNLLFDLFALDNDLLNAHDMFSVSGVLA
ncbi:hypothetical protein DYB25_003141 [Aphanomyces astaci]|uniref:Uncharacterized protein n=3 Tax=Aphanomyces astaci TaxID=112090 RepID=A0A397DZ34_APHAT|nr:hypothetical protein DYB25_003141 [Aphanomyces astaci]RHY70911.1 hypothetical protein DYB38_008477 [Aphanomyces astaci]RHY78140.1 hypothetical protein DYB34_009696 [Aphanomyces astaci]RHY94403.1 hypothetical protein DYB31_013210 [Aphanomyces astaci]